MCFVEALFYVFLKLHSVSSVFAFLFGYRFVEALFYVFLKLHSVSSVFGAIFTFAVGLEVSIS